MKKKQTNKNNKKTERAREERNNHRQIKIVIHFDRTPN
jgi:hypothetical protein